MPRQISPGLIALTDIDWSRVHSFFCDERVVPFNDPESTFGVYQASLFSKLPVEPHVHKIDTARQALRSVQRLIRKTCLISLAPRRVIQPLTYFSSVLDPMATLAHSSPTTNYSRYT